MSRKVEDLHDCRYNCCLVTDGIVLSSDDTAIVKFLVWVVEYHQELRGNGGLVDSEGLSIFGWSEQVKL